MAEATLADLSLGIKKTNDTLEETLSAQKKLNALIVKQNKSTFAGDDLEGQREKDKSQAEATAVRESKSGGGVSDEGGGLLSKLGLGGGLAAAGGAMGLAKMIGARGIRSALLVALADEAGNAVEAYTGSAEAGDAVERGMVVGGIASIFGAKFGFIGGVIGAALTEDNQKKLEKLKEALEPHTKALQEKVTEFIGFTPTLEGTMKGIESTIGGALTGLTNLANGDYSELKTNLTDIGLTAAGIMAMLMPGKALSLLFAGLKLPFKMLGKGLGGLAGLAVGGGTAAAAGGTTAAAAAAATFKGGTKGVTASGEKVTFNEKTQRFHSDKTNKMVKAADVKGAKLPKPQAGAATTTPKPTGGGKAIAGRLGKFLRFPGIAGLLGAYNVYDILNSDAPDDVKKKELVKFMGGMIGTLAGVKFGALLGGALGTIGFPGLGSLAGGVAGATLFGGAGYFGGEALAGSLANFIMGDKPKATSGGTSTTPAALPSTNTQKAATNQMNPADQAAAMSRPARSTPIQSGGAMGEFGGGSTVIAPTITNNTGQSTTVITPPTPSANNSEDPVRELSGMGFVL